jgi:hypothetical protein
VRTADQALARAEAGSELADAIGKRRALYAASRPYREP